MKRNCCIFKTLEAECGNRPRFKEIKDKSLLSRLLIVVTSIVIALDWKLVNCDQWMRADAAHSNELNKLLHTSQHFPQADSLKPMSLVINNNNDDDDDDDDDESKTAELSNNSQLSSLSLSFTSDESASLKVAALASKLEQWFQCRKPTPLLLHGIHQDQEEQQQQQIHPKSSDAACPAHFDGHLCWPATESGKLVQLPCPKLNMLLLSDEKQQEQQQHQSVKSVITSTSTSTSIPIQASNSTPSILSHTSDQTTSNTFTEPAINQRSEQVKAQFAYRKCEPTISSNLMLVSEQDKTAVKRLKVQWQEHADYGGCKLDRNKQEFDPTDKWIKLNEEEDKKLFERLVLELDRIEATIDPYGDPDLLEQWTLCIGNIMHHQHQLFNQSNNNKNRAAESASTTTNSSIVEGKVVTGDLWCPIIFDGWRCWPSTKAAEIAYVSCPSNQPGFSAERKAHKICTANGTWYRHPMTNRYWSNYTTCVDTVDLAFRTKILNLYVIGNLISLVALSASLIIFISFKSLSCTRVTIHKNLFLSFITNNLMWIIWYTYVVNDADLLQSNPIECQFWHILLHYFLVSNYFWMFCEGLYLHTLLVVAFVSEDKILKWFYLLGWLTPVPITVAYAYNRSYDDYYTNFCWMEESPYNLILMAPIGISLLLNLVFLINIVRVLVTKLRANNSPDTHQTRKAVRATLILIPLLGLHYILTPFRPEAKSEWEVIYESVAAACTSFQGLCVALLFCFCNGEVITVIKKKLKDTFNLNHSSPNGQMRARSNTGASLIALNNSTTTSSFTANTVNRIRSVISSTPSIGRPTYTSAARINGANNNNNNNNSSSNNNNNNNNNCLRRQQANGTTTSDNSNSSFILTTTLTASPPITQLDNHPLVSSNIKDDPATQYLLLADAQQSPEEQQQPTSTHLIEPIFHLAHDANEILTLLPEEGATLTTTTTTASGNQFPDYSMTTNFTGRTS